MPISKKHGPVPVTAQAKAIEAWVGDWADSWRAPVTRQNPTRRIVQFIRISGWLVEDSAE